MRDFFRNNGAWILLIAVLLTAILSIFSALFGGLTDPLSNLWGVLTSPIRGISNSFVSWSEGVYNYSFRYEQLEKEKAALEKRVAELEVQTAEGNLAIQENQRLKDLLGLKERRPEFDFEAASVTSRTSSNWEALLTISKGSIHDIAPGDCVINEHGALIGIVTEVGINWSTVQTIVDVNTNLGGLVPRTDSTAIVEGDFSLMLEGRLKLTYLPEDTRLIAGDLVLTSGMNGTYPPGLIIGSIQELKMEPSGMTQYAILAPKADLDEVKQVFVIRDFQMVE